MTFLFWYENNNRSFIGLFYCYYFKEMRGCSGLLTSAGISGYGCQEVRRHTERRACRQAMEAWAQWKPVLPSCKVVLKLAPMVLMRPACEFKQPVCVCVCVCWGVGGSSGQRQQLTGSMERALAPDCSEWQSVEGGPGTSVILPMATENVPGVLNSVPVPGPACLQRCPFGV